MRGSEGPSFKLHIPLLLGQPLSCRDAPFIGDALETTAVSLILGLAVGPAYQVPHWVCVCVVICRSYEPCGLSVEGPGVNMGRIAGAITEFGAQLESLGDSFGGSIFEEPELPSDLASGGEKPSLFRAETPPPQRLPQQGSCQPRWHLGTEKLTQPPSHPLLHSFLLVLSR